MRTFHKWLWLTAWGLAQTGCTDAFIAMTPDGGEGSSSGATDAAGDTGSADATADTGSSDGTADTGSDHAVADTGSRDGAADTGSGDAGAACSTNADCPLDYLCGFPEALACSATGTCFPAPGVTCNAIELGCACDGADITLGCNGLPSGYVAKPFLHQGPCADASGGDSGTGEAGAKDGGATDSSTPNDSGGGCVSTQGGPCGGNTNQPCTCASGLVCTPGNSGVATGDVGGTCEAHEGDGSSPCTTDADCDATQACGFPQSEGCAAQGQCVTKSLVVCTAIAFGCACDGTEINIACNDLPGGYETQPLAHSGPCTSP
ncbi:MAG: hypothetical protein ABSF69_02665 [Polyangiaceae bacterium]|jgi:hypothetical protein